MALVVLVGLLGAVAVRLGGRAIDLEVYRTGGAVWRAGLPLYGDGYPYGLGVYLPFTYPPLAALLLGLTSFLPSPVAVAVLSAASLLALGAASYLAGHQVRLTRPWAEVPLSVTVVLATLALALQPVRSTLFFGQVNLVLMAMVTADVLLRHPRWPRGLLIGVAAAVKLTPLAFLLVLLCRRQWRAGATAVVTFVAAQALGALLLPADSRAYWLGGVLTAPGRIGAADTASNLSLRGVLTRAWPDAPVLVWLALVAVTGVLAVAATRRRAQRGDDLGALLSTAAGGLLVSPVSWTHHWVWVVPALVWLAARARGEHHPPQP
ncbi:MAG: glycosyltransferase 87 family protein, partial [Actinomycetota bacterium]|nr:glycosyltransferase 87 family protein [Actinomycetota bacterium]